MENLLVQFLPRILIREFNDRSVTLLITNPTSSVAYIKLDHPLVPDYTMHINSYDPFIDMVTAEGETEN